jgi:N utilization substance protein A
MSVKIIYNKEIMKFIAFFEAMTNAPVKDCLVDTNSQLIFIVNKDNMGKAIGRKGSNVRKIESALKRKIKIVEFNPLVIEFVKNLISPLKAEISEQNNTLHIRCHDANTRSLLIGRDARNIRNYENIVKRYFNKQLKVV